MNNNTSKNPELYDATYEDFIWKPFKNQKEFARFGELPISETKENFDMIEDLNKKIRKLEENIIEKEKEYEILYINYNILNQKNKNFEDHDKLIETIDKLTKENNKLNEIIFKYKNEKNDDVGLSFIDNDLEGSKFLDDKGFEDIFCNLEKKESDKKIELNSNNKSKKNNNSKNNESGNKVGENNKSKNIIINKYLKDSINLLMNQTNMNQNAKSTLSSILIQLGCSDEDIYKIAPTFVLSTVDKFARITWEEKSGSLLGENGCKPPELIIQDELHLISGPLGSLAGIYEMAVEHICRHYGRSPKIIASTATVKNADEQIKTIYDRNMIQFPPNGLSYDDSFFSVQASEEKRSARTYIGICSIGSGTSEMLIKIFGVLTYMKYLYKKQGLDTNVIDQFYTYVGYFNSLKELGSNSIIVSDRILSEVKYLVTYKFGEEAQKAGLSVKDIPPFMKNNELTSRNGSAEIKSILDRLDVRCTSEDCYDYIMASNMLSVGIDIDRLGVMCVYGQPKSNSEYIQATSRVGRSNPGLVITIYNNMRSRDKSFFEQFIYYHKTFYKYVEATSVTSYSPRAIEKALHSAMMAIIRHTISKYNPNEGASRFDRDDNNIQNIKEQIIKRVNDIEPWQAEYAEEWLDYYLDCWKELCDSIPDRLVFSDYHDEDKALLRSGENQNGSDIPTVLNSVRNVESSVSIYFTKR